MTLGGEPLRLELGGLRFVVRCASAPIQADLDAPYRPFVQVNRARADCNSCLQPDGDIDDIEVDVRLQRPPTLSGATPLFETGQPWGMRADGDRRMLYRQAPRETTPYVMATFQLGVDRVTMWLDPTAWPPDADRLDVPCPLRYPFDQILLMYALARVRGLLVHATGVVLEERALVCCGVSGAGKSTLARQFLSAGVGELLCDDRMIMRRREDGLLAYGTPWPSDARVAVNASAPLEALLFLRQGARNRITELPPGDALHRLLPVASIPWFDADVVSTSLGICDEIIAAVPAFELQFRPEPAAAELVRDFVASGALA